MNQSAASPYHTGLHYFLQGLTLIRQPGLRRFVLIPLAINLLLFSIAFTFLFQKIDGIVASTISHLPSYLSWIGFFLEPLLFASFILTAAYLFTIVMNFIAAPFNGLLAEKVELYLTNQPLNDDGIIDLIKDTPRILKRELTKLTYYLPRALLFLILLIFLPGVGAFLWFGFSAWMLAIQYLDYPFDNHKVPFNRMLAALGQQRFRAFTFGGICAFTAAIPLINLIVMPVAVCAATVFWVDKYREQHRL
ncbi:MAG: sulfate transporter CysZ [Ferrimonas sp.]